jgi:hypothetical protein
MKLNKLFFRLLLSSLLIGLFVSVIPFQGAMTEFNETTFTTDGQIGDVTYDYGTISQSGSASTSFSESFTESSIEINNDTFQTDIWIQTGIEETNVIWDRYYNECMLEPSNEWVFEAKKFNDSGIFGAWWRYENYDQWNNWSQSIAGLSENWLLPEWWTTTANKITINTTTVNKQDIFGNVYGQTDLSTYQIDYIFENGTDDVVVYQELLVPDFVLITVQTELVTVDIEKDVTLISEISGSYNYSGDYQFEKNGYHVTISDPNDFYLNYLSLKDYWLNYTYEAGFTLTGDVSLMIDYDVTFHNDSSPVPEEIRPFWCKSSITNSSGRWSATFNEYLDVNAVAALEGILELIHTREGTANNLAMYASWRPGYELGYVDLDNNDMLNGEFVNGELSLQDEIMAVGVPLGAHMVGNYQSDGYSTATFYQEIGGEVIADENVDEETHIDESIEIIEGFDPETSPTEVTLDWTEPVQNNATGEITFAWETNYDDMPVSWWSTNGTHEMVVQETQDLTYGYEFTITPDQGETYLASTYETTSLNNDTLLDRVNGLQMATVRRDAFLSVTHVNDNVDSAWTEEWDELDVTVGGHPLMNMDFTGSKGVYELQNGTGPIDATTGIINLYTAWGSVYKPDNETYVTESYWEFDNSMGQATTIKQADEFFGSSTWYLREDLVTTCYPVWDGQGIIHDPGITTYYEPTAAPPPTTTSPPPTTTTPEETTSETSVTFSYYGFLAFFLAVPVVVLFFKRRKK